MHVQPAAARRGAARSTWPTVAFLLLPLGSSLAANETLQSDAERGAKVTHQEPFEPYRKKIALVVGIDRYSKGIQPLGYAVADARSVGHLLATEYGFEVRVLKDAQATRKALINTIIGLQEGTSGDDQLLFFFAGHGVSFGDGDQEVGYILPYDAAGAAQSNAWLSGIPMNELVGHLATPIIIGGRTQTTEEILPEFVAGWVPRTIQQKHAVSEYTFLTKQAVLKISNVLETVALAALDAITEGSDFFVHALRTSLATMLDVQPAVLFRTGETLDSTLVKAEILPFKTVILAFTAEEVNAWKPADFERLNKVLAEKTTALLKLARTPRNVHIFGEVPYLYVPRDLLP